MKYFNRYLLTSGISGLIYKTYKTHDIRVKREDNKITRLLLGERLLLISHGIILSPILSPFYIGDMIDRIDIYINKDFEYEDKKIPKTLKELFND